MGSVFSPTGRRHSEPSNLNREHDDQLVPPHEFAFVPKENYIMDLGDEFDELKEKLGSGSTCSVLSMRHKSTGRHCAVKKMSRSHKSAFRREATTLLQIRHNHVVGLIGVYVDWTNYYVATELCTGGNVLERVPLPEEEAIEVSYQILDAVKYLHDHNMVHRDIKLENIVYRSEESNQIALIDFGLARKVKESDEFKKCAGTPVYMAPEMGRVLTGEDLKIVDMWAVGIAVFILLTRHYPFYATDRRELHVRICQQRLVFPRRPDTSLLARKFIASLLRRNMTNRLSASQAMQHEWLHPARACRPSHPGKPSPENPPEPTHSSIQIAIDDMDDATISMIGVDNDGEEEYAEMLRSNAKIRKGAALEDRKVCADQIHMVRGDVEDGEKMIEGANTNDIGLSRIESVALKLSKKTWT